MDVEERRFRAFLRARGLRVTPERRAALGAARQAPHHFEAEDLLAEVRKGGTPVSKATLYRTLALMVEAGVLQRINFGNKTEHYEHTFGVTHHDHLVCVSCGEIVEFVHPGIERAQTAACRRLGFVETSHRMILFGRCRACREKGVSAGAAGG